MSWLTNRLSLWVVGILDRRQRNDRHAPHTHDDECRHPRESDHSLTIGPDGPILLHDHYLIEQLAQFNR
jgi:catalase